MKLPDSFKILVITLSDRASRGEYKDESGPRIIEFLTDFFRECKWENEMVHRIIPDDGVMLEKILEEAFQEYHLVFTTGGTGIGPKDITVDIVLPMLDKNIPGIMELIRVKYGLEKPNALLSRGVAGIAGKSLIFTLPGSIKAVNEYLDEIGKSLEHTIYMQYGVDVHGRR